MVPNFSPDFHWLKSKERLSEGKGHGLHTASFGLQAAWPVLPSSIGKS